ncbi:hypothetical protein BHM03_00055632 [Ensete ventricosum]|nr:hypothetical protein BHM03_00055632 [Ensete ventricosum]
MKLALKGHLGIWCNSLPLRMLVVIDLKCFPLVSARSEFNGEVLVLSSCDLFDSTSCSASSSIMEQGGPYTDLQNCSAEAIKNLLPDYVNGDLSALCSWPDEVRDQQSMSSFHFVNTPDEACSFDYSSKIQTLGLSVRGQQRTLIFVSVVYRGL